MAQKKGYGILLGKDCWKTKGALPGQDDNHFREYKAMHEENFLSCCEGMWKKEKQKWRGLNEEAKQEGSKRGKREVERERERVEIKRMFFN